MARTSITLPSGRHRAWVLAVAAGTALVVVVAVAVWALLVRSGDDPTRSAAAATSRTAASQGPRTDPIPVNPWAFNDPATVVRFLEGRCPGAPPITPEMVDGLIPALQACLASTPPNTASAQTSAIDVNSLWQQLATLPAPDRDNLVAGLAPNVRAGLARIAEVAAAVAVNR
jgi:hypothetical protein